MKTPPFFDLFRKKKKTDEELDAAAILIGDEQRKEGATQEPVAVEDREIIPDICPSGKLPWQAKIDVLTGKNSSSDNLFIDAPAETRKGRRREKEITREEIKEAAKEVAREIETEIQRETQPYRLPAVSLLNKTKSSNAGKENSLEEAIASVFKNKGITAVYVEKSRGPKYTRYEFKVAVGTRLATVTNAHKDIAFAVGAGEVMISPVIGKPSTVAVDIPNTNQDEVFLREAIESKAFAKSDDKTLFAIGKDTAGNIVFGSLPNVRGLLLSGTTGAGKSVFLNSLIISLLYKASPDDVHFLLIDPKMVEFAPYNGIPHLVIPVQNDPQKASFALEWVVFEMMKRYKTFADLGVKDLTHYNLIAENNHEIKKLPAIVILIDELDSLLAVRPEETNEAIDRIVQLGLAAGIYLVAASSKPKKATIERMPSRIAFAAASAAQSVLVIGKEGAERLLGQGDMLFMQAGGKSLQNLQGFYVSPEEIERVVEHVKQNGEVRNDQEVMDQIVAAERLRNGLPLIADDIFDEKQSDELLDAAMDIVFEIGQASTSMLQRKLKLGYSRASRLVDMMEKRGFVGPFEGSKPRQILITKQQWHELKLMRSGADETESRPEIDRYGSICDIFESHDALD